MTYTSEVVLFQKSGTGRVEEVVTPGQKGWVAYAGSYWSAKFYQADFAGTIAPGEQVTVLGRQGNTLLVMPRGYAGVEPHRQKEQLGRRSAIQQIRLCFG
ncbi:MAG: NfeD family protein [Prochlorotrichaceae cyanobacterium]|jgi:membrane-bound ClpP family serine protease